MFLTIWYQSLKKLGKQHGRPPELSAGNLSYKRRRRYHPYDHHHQPFRPNYIPHQYQLPLHNPVWIPTAIVDGNQSYNTEAPLLPCQNTTEDLCSKFETRFKVIDDKLQAICERLTVSALLNRHSATPRSVTTQPPSLLGESSARFMARIRLQRSNRPLQVSGHRCSRRLRKWRYSVSMTLFAIISSRRSQKPPSKYLDLINNREQVDLDPKGINLVEDKDKVLGDDEETSGDNEASDLDKTYDVDSRQPWKLPWNEFGENELGQIKARMNLGTEVQHRHFECSEITRPPDLAATMVYSSHNNQFSVSLPNISQLHTPLIPSHVVSEPTLPLPIQQATLLQSQTPKICYDHKVFDVMQSTGCNPNELFQPLSALKPCHCYSPLIFPPPQAPSKLPESSSNHPASPSLNTLIQFYARVEVTNCAYISGSVAQCCCLFAREKLKIGVILEDASSNRNNVIGTDSIGVDGSPENVKVIYIMEGTGTYFKREALLQDMFLSAKTTVGRLHLAKELLTEVLKSFAGIKEGLTILIHGYWILWGMMGLTSQCSTLSNK